MESNTMLTIVSACFFVSWTTRATSSTSSALVITPAPGPASSSSSRSLSWSFSSSKFASSPPVHEPRESPADDALEHALGIAPAGEQIEDIRFAAPRPDPGRLAFDAGRLRGGAHGIIDRSELVDELQAEGFFAGEDAAVGDAGDVRFRQFPAASFGHRAHELRVQLRDDVLKVLALVRRQIAIRRAGVFHRAAGDRLRLQLR